MGIGDIKQRIINNNKRNIKKNKQFNNIFKIVRTRQEQYNKI